MKQLKFNHRKINLRVVYALAFSIFLIVEVIIALFMNDDFIRPYVGDMLVVVVVYCFVRIFIPEKFKLMPLYVFIFAALIEGLQYLKLVEVLGLQNNTFARVIIGSVFDWKDILCYGVGCVLLGLYEKVIK